METRLFSAPTLIALKGLLLASLALGLTACDDSKTPAAKPAQKANPAMRLPQVGVLSVQMTQVPNQLAITGRAQASATAEIRPQVEGIITQRLFKEGSFVNKGDTLYQLDAASYQALYESAKAAVEKSKALLTNAQIKVTRNERLVKINAVSEQVLDDAKALLREAKANLAANQAALKTAAIQLERTQIKAPISGRIGRSTVTKGALVTTNQAQSLATIQQLDPIYVDFSVTANQALPLRKALANEQVNLADYPVRLKLPHQPYPSTGKILLSEFQVNPATDAVILRTQFQNPDTLILPGMFMQGQVTTGMLEQVALIPTLSLQRNALGQPFVMVLTPDNTVAVKPVKEAGLYQENWIITDGLAPGDQVIVKGLQFIRPGMKAALIPVQGGAS
ncbi:efflux RND transporter periplasmic adaptor subunit [Hydrogenovibrio sp. SC-1]|uniref:efflux RND transporter periplasmic adaptor subunit n=1 Tax=Hydrogenovibrio sp. SC-1 TaxID=2065820 RepID=UPI000C7D4528|nr:efflux RND transporter periplasmic adaptor subunit [Hydrogenovibrio sp. SC-1]PLA75499.1 efflux RND transporter periplasmic adaptor subunit [Hydrogenovibrio sp. SC-1]